MQTGNNKPRKSGSWIEKDNCETLLVLGTACGHHNDGNLHYQLQVTWGKRFALLSTNFQTLFNRYVQSSEGQGKEESN